MKVIPDVPERKSLDELTGMSRQRRWQIRRVLAGLCQICGKPRTAKGSDTLCRTHVRARQKNHAKRRAA